MHFFSQTYHSWQIALGIMLAFLFPELVLTGKKWKRNLKTKWTWENTTGDGWEMAQWGWCLSHKDPWGHRSPATLKKKKKIKSRHGCRVLGWGGVGGKDRRIPGSQGKGWGQSACEMQKLLCPCPSHLRSPRSHSWTRRHPLATPHLLRCT